MITPASEAEARTERAQWFAEEVHRHEPALRTYLRGAFPRVRDLEDVIQESYARIWRRHSSGPIKSARAFLFTIARRLVFDHLRQQRRSPIAAVQDVEGLAAADVAPTAADRMGDAEKVALLVEAIDALPARCREVVILRKLKQLPQREVAQRLRISEKGVEVQLARGVARCRAFLTARGMRSLFGDEPA
jgi:RNA polymerase sigma-70 factor (ECF subfamily)